MKLSELKETISTEPEVDVCRLHWNNTADDRRVHGMPDPDDITATVLQQWRTGRPLNIIGVAAINEDGTKVVITEDEDSGLVQYELMQPDGHLGGVRE